MKTVLYARVSTEDQTCEPQLLELRAEAKKRGLETWEEITDVASGARRDRVGLERLMAAIRRGEVGTIMAVRLDRVARSLSHFGQLSDELVRRGVGLILTAQGVDTTGSNPCGRLLQGLLAVIAEFERDLIRERTRAGLAVARAQGKTLGRPSKIMVPVPERAGIVAAWRAETGGNDYRDLGMRLGGVGPSTAWRVAQTGG